MRQALTLCTRIEQSKSGLCAKDRCGRIQSSSRSGGIESSLSALHVLHRLLLRLCWQMLLPPHSLHSLSRRLCWQMLPPPHSIHVLLVRLCWQMPPPPHSLHSLFRRLCWQMPSPPQSLHHRCFCRLCWQMLPPPHSLHRLLCRLCSHCPGFPPLACFASSLLPPSSPSAAARFLLPSPLC